MSLSKRLKDLRIENRWTQKELSDKLGIPRTTYSGWETGEREPDVEMLKNIASVFGVSVDYLVGNTEIRSNVETLAFHRAGKYDDNLPPEAIERIEEFIELMKLKHSKKPSQ